MTDEKKPGFWARSPIGTTIIAFAVVGFIVLVLVDTRLFGLVPAEPEPAPSVAVPEPIALTCEAWRASVKEPLLGELQTRGVDRSVADFERSCFAMGLDDGGGYLASLDVTINSYATDTALDDVNRMRLGQMAYCSPGAPSEPYGPVSCFKTPSVVRWSGMIRQKTVRLMIELDRKKLPAAAEAAATTPQALATELADRVGRDLLTRV
ncbi:hypothetical protein Afil01_18260 [Actinorhabdospora filicis]|uniref:Uncharacterized protein n=1 Tax=Actinorhabdospora filicis TaxID=1785913 RepID=A0A9W6SJZ4_9ACTN|nr:hypothetical protein [Actinorhabdospora filicis]GLZ77019.1 hypothetical protein Afil01_18260 [Actinorhabdospora filicis]